MARLAISSPRRCCSHRRNLNLGGIIQITPNWPPQVTTLYQFFGLLAYEGIHSDDKGVIYMEEDTAGPRPGGLATIDGVPNLPLKAAAQPNSFVYRYVPNNPERIEDGGKLQALQVIIDGAPSCSMPPIQSATSQQRCNASCTRRERPGPSNG